MKCDCSDCGFRGMGLCEHRKLIDKVNARNKVIDSLCCIIKEAIECVRLSDCHDLCDQERMSQCINEKRRRCLIMQRWGSLVDEARKTLTDGAN